MPPVRRSARNVGKQPENGHTAEAKPKKTQAKRRKVEKVEKVEKEVVEEKDEEVEAEEAENGDSEPQAWQSAASIYEFSAKKLNEEEEVSLAEYKGHVCIIVNVASRCGHTKSNYEQLVELYDKYAEEKGLRILAFPCNQFGGQEPGSSDKIQEFCEKRNVKFDVFEKINVNGKNAHDLYKYLKEKLPGPKGKDIKWNFTKFIVDKEGQPTERFEAAVKPLTMLENLEKLW